MDHTKTHRALVALLIVGLTGCTTDGPPSSSSTEPMRPIFQSQSPLIEGQVLRDENNAYVIREISGRQTRVFFNQHTVRDTILVGDTVVARFDGPLSSVDGPPPSVYAASITRSTGRPLPPLATAAPRFQTVEGILQQQEGNEYVVREHSGKDVRFYADNTTKLDRNIRRGDRVVVVTSTMPFDASIYNMYKLGNPNVLQGDVVRVAGDGYVIRDSGGRDMRLHVDNTSKFDRNIMAGDRVVVMTNPMPSDAPHVVTMYRLNSPHVVQGEVVWIDENGYVVRDFTGRDVRLQTTSATVRNDTLRVGDRIIADMGPSSTVHMESITKR